MQIPSEGDFMNWYAIYTKPRTEETVSESLRRAGIQVYTPKLRIKKYIRNKYREMIEPLFPCYLFAKFEPNRYLWMITYTRGVKKVVGAKDAPWPVSEEVIDLIRCHEEDGFVRLTCEDIREGDAVKVVDGPLSGIKGIFKSVIKGTERVILLLNALEYQARAIVERASLIKVC